MEPCSKVIPKQPQSPVSTKTSQDDGKDTTVKRLPPHQDSSDTTTPDSLPIVDRSVGFCNDYYPIAINSVRQNTSDPAKYEIYSLPDYEPGHSSYAIYRNFDEGSIKYAAQVGNHKLISLKNNETPYKSELTEEGQQEVVLTRKFNYIAEFLTKNKGIKYIVDIGCGDAKISLALQKYLDQSGFDVAVCPVDVFYREECHLPINVIPAQLIKGADQNVAFTAIRACTNSESCSSHDEFYITTLIKNNPGCFVLVSETTGESNPNLLIPIELVYTKRFGTNINPEKSNELQKKLDVINHTMDHLSRIKDFWSIIGEKHKQILKEDAVEPDFLEEPESSEEPDFLEEPERTLYRLLDRQIGDKVADPHSWNWTHKTDIGALYDYFNWHVYRQNSPEKVLS